jgi:hypothetical protein
MWFVVFKAWSVIFSRGSTFLIWFFIFFGGSSLAITIKGWPQCFMLGPCCFIIFEAEPAVFDHQLPRFRLVQLFLTMNHLFLSRPTFFSMNQPFQT